MGMKQKCAECTFFLASSASPSEAVGKCRRYPDFVNRMPDDWCGEFKRRHPVGKTYAQFRTKPKQQDGQL